MNPDRKTTRRHFLQTSGTCLLGTGLLGKTPSAWSVSQKPNVISCRDTHLDQVEGAKDVFAAMKRIGITNVEVVVNFERICSSFFHPTKKYSIAVPKAVDALRRDLDENGVKISAFCMANRFDERLEDELAWVGDVVAAAKALNVKAIRIDYMPHKIEPEEYLDFSIAAGKQLVRIVEGTEIRYGIENHGSMTNNPEFLTGLFEGVGSEAMGLTLDTGNFYWYGHPLQDVHGIFKRFASRVCHTHCKSINYPKEKRNSQRPMGWEYGKYCSPVYEGDIDFNRVAAILYDAGYEGDFCIENESLERFPEAERGAVLKREVEHLRKLL